MKIEAGTSADVKPDGTLVMGVGLDPLPKPPGQVVPPSAEDTATRLARLARDGSSWEGARAALLRAMRLTREWERDETMLAHNVER